MSPRPTWNEILAGDVYVINMGRSGERWRQTQERVVAAGFSEERVRRLVAVDASQSAVLEDAWNTLFPTRPTFDLVKDPEFRRYVGKQGCFLSHVKLWKWMVETETPWVTLFEDDVLFHPEWSRLAPEYYARTPEDWELVYLGSQMDFQSTYPIDRGAVYCTHAMLLTLSAAKRLYAMVCAAGTRLYTIDNLFHDLQASGNFPVCYYVWNGQCFPTALAKMGNGWERRNHGLVFQDEAMGSYIKEHY